MGFESKGARSSESWGFVQGVADRLFADRLIRNANSESVSLLKSDSTGPGLGGLQSGQDVIALFQLEQRTKPTTLGGSWDWDNGQFGFKAGVSVYHPTASVGQLLQLDKTINDGNLATGEFRSRSDGYIGIIED